MTDRAVVSLGNPYRRDDGVGPALLEELARRDLPDVDLLDLGDATFELVHVLAAHDVVVIVDAVNFGGDPGEIAVFDPDSVADATEGQRGAHDTNPFEVLAVTDRLAAAPDAVRIVGIQPAAVGFGEDLSPAVAEGLSEATETVVELLRTV